MRPGSVIWKTRSVRWKPESSQTSPFWKKTRLLGPERARFYDPCASALAAGLKISLHSDWNVTPIEPLRYVEDAVTRVM
ncbi:amidohydrolase family protein, partial [Klebsiella pneumoniae subsp. pneumoniae]